MSSVSSAVMALLCASGEPVDLAHKATSSIAAASACWLCSSKVSTSAVAMLASVLSGMVVILEWVVIECGLPGLSSKQSFNSPSPLRNDAGGWAVDIWLW